MKLNIKNTFIEQLPGDPNLDNTRRQVSQACYSFVSPQPPSHPKLVHVSNAMGSELGLSKADLDSEEFLDVVTGKTIYIGTKPFAMCYAGHQFGNWAGQLGDGRAINLFEVEHHNKQWMLQLKGAGPTPYSRSGDGMAVLRSSIREYLCSEAMFYLGVPTTRALSLALTGDEVMRDVMYNGNSEYEKGAIVCRVSPSFLRFGSYEIFSARQDHENLKRLVDFTINQHYSHLGQPSKQVYLNFFEEVCQRTLEMIIHWQRVGFVHGVMNTDNMSILGLTIDYGPYGWLEGFDFGWTPNTTDRVNKRYRYGNQPNMGLWNLYQLANALYPIIEDAPAMEKILKAYTINYETESLSMMRSKLGLNKENAADQTLIETLEDLLQSNETDMTIFFRRLASFSKDAPSDGLEIVKAAFYDFSDITSDSISKWNNWFTSYGVRLQAETVSDEKRVRKMNAVNPKYVLRNYMAQMAIDEADKGNYQLIDELFQLLKLPYDEQPQHEKWFAKRPEWARNKVGCSMLSCSS